MVTDAHCYKTYIYPIAGQLYEEECIDLYAARENDQVLEFGLVVHPVHTFLAGSPDGISLKPRLIEAKWLVIPYLCSLTATLLRVMVTFRLPFGSCSTANVLWGHWFILLSQLSM